MQVVTKYVWLGVTLSRNAITCGPAFATVTKVLVHYNGNQAIQNDR